MPDESQIRINTLLLEREALFLRVNALEQQAADLLGEPFPFEPPVLPSNRRGKRKATRRAKPGANKIKLRKLAEGESAYRVNYRQHGTVRTERYDVAEPLLTLLAAQGAELEVLTIETVDAQDVATATLFGPAS
ncbi:hypothetical protein [Synoicihabitans lomoniglobus]|uniref:Uncharacterized protein n=1 Tax=Synoicihabitans lomoniglobus TaxID=2909285 RepID=A0AAF0CN95_9BACT|nr:hypothetical protein [Opitutaceae bacterium LMO-M01]WED64145.1 hypothetical protein PXH66_17545 [Opitutaceae bacterium LMO-M01]